MFTSQDKKKVIGCQAIFRRSGLNTFQIVPYSNLLPAIAYKEMVKIQVTLPKHILKWVSFTTWVVKLIQTESLYPIIFILVIVCCQP